MRLYSGRIINSALQKQSALSREMYNGVLEEVDYTYGFAWVRIQGTDTRVKAYFPQNLDETPRYMRYGNAVLITHPGGNRGRIEIIGEGLLQPTSIYNIPVTPVTPTYLNAILTGCVVTGSIPESMYTRVSTGTYRINSVIYTISPFSMDMATIEMDRFDIKMDELGVTQLHDAASATYFRYDSLCVGEDGVVDIVKGTNFLSTGVIPDPPAAPANHLRVGFVLIPPGETSIDSGLVNKTFVGRKATNIEVTVDDADLLWAEETTTVRIGVRDQYGSWFQNPSGWVFTISWVNGNGTLSYGGQSQDETASFVVRHTGASTIGITYTRNKAADDSSPMLYVSEANPQCGMGSAYIQLYDSTGLMVP